LAKKPENGHFGGYYPKKGLFGPFRAPGPVRGGWFYINPSRRGPVPVPGPLTPRGWGAPSGGGRPSP